MAQDDGSPSRMCGLINVNLILAAAMVPSTGTAPHAGFVARRCEEAASLELRKGIDEMDPDDFLRGHFQVSLGCCPRRSTAAVDSACILQPPIDLSMGCRDIQDRQ